VAPRVHLGRRHPGGHRHRPPRGRFLLRARPHGFTCHWGRVLAWDPPTRLVFAWQIAPDRAPEPNPAKASEVEVRFHPSDPTSTRVDLEHRAFPRHGDAADTYRQALASPQGWPLILARYAATLP